MYEPMAVKFDSALRMILSHLSIRSWREERSEEWEDLRAFLVECISLTSGGGVKEKRKKRRRI